MESLGSISLFVLVAETRSFTQAGKRLGISSSGVGKSIGRLEDRLGVRLFQRNTRSIALTLEGSLFLERCRRILSELEAAEMELSNAREKPRGKLRISLPLVSGLVMPAIIEFMRTYPEIELDIDFSDRMVDVIEEGFDAVLRTGEPTDSRLISKRLGASSCRLWRLQPISQRMEYPNAQRIWPCIHACCTSFLRREKWNLGLYALRLESRISSCLKQWCATRLK